MTNDLELMYRLLSETQQPGGISAERWPGWSAEVQPLLARVEGRQWREHRAAAAGLRLLSLSRRELYILAVLLERARAQWRLARPEWADATASEDVQPISPEELESLIDRLRADAGAPRQLDAPLPVELEMEAVRDALRRDLDDTSLRDLARQIGITPTALANFRDGAHPYQKTLAKLRRWMAARRRSAE